MRQRVAWLLKPDRHSDGAYHISSLYFDDVHNTSLWQKQNGVLLRNKLRIRYYNNDMSFLRLEHKHKDGEMISKRSVPVSLEQYESIRNGDYSFILAETHPLWRMFYARRQTLGLAPVVMVEYDRTVYTYQAGNVRVTFDSGLRASQPFSNLSLPALPPGWQVLEVKYDHFLPAVIADMLARSPLTQLAISKYAICREAMANAHFHSP